MPDGLYDADIVVWAEHQADLLRRLAAGERLNEQVDWVNLIEEVEDVGRSQVSAVESLLLQALVHLVKLYREPAGPSAQHWRSETVVFLRTARRRFTPSMRTRLDLPDLFADACKATEQPGTQCPYTLEMLLDDNADSHALAALLQHPA